MPVGYNREFKERWLWTGGLDLPFKVIVLPKLTYGLSMYGASKAELNTIECFFKEMSQNTFPTN